jgi:hypothetical protein
MGWRIMRIRWRLGFEPTGGRFARPRRREAPTRVSRKIDREACEAGAELYQEKKNAVK